MSRSVLVRLSVAVLLLAAVPSCDFPTAPEDRLPTPRRTGDGWDTGSLKSVGMDEGPLEDLIDLISRTPDHRIHSILIVKDRRLVFERYWPGEDLDPATLEPVERSFDRETLHYVASVSKSITSILAGIALDRELFGGVGDPVFSFFPENADLETEENGSITVRHLLSFSSGYDWNEFVYGFGDARDSHFQMFDADDPVRYLLDRPVVTDPGAEFHYNSGDTNLLGEIVRRVSSSERLTHFAREHLFEPLGIDTVLWVRFRSAPHVTFASGGASLRPRDMAKLGTLYLNDGLWNGVRVVSSAWVEESTRMAIPLIGNYRTLHGYGYNWWLGRSRFREGTVEYYQAAGWGGQYIYVFPDLDLVLVFTAGGFYEDGPLNVNDIIEHYIFRAIIE